ncbi:hypothetical protein ACFLXF_00960 [Chloroflexota bacterium]
MRKTAGILNIISGGLHLSGAIFILIFGWLGDGIFNILWYGMIGTPLTPIAQTVAQELQATIAIPVIVLSIFVIIVGIYAIRGRSWRLVVIGSICGALLAWFLGIPAIILTVISKKGFK